MSEVEPGIKRKVFHGLAWTAGGLALSTSAALGFMSNAEESTVVAGHEARVAPTFDSHLTLEAPGLPGVRVPTNNIVGAKISLADSSELTDQDALIIANPTGEIDKVTRTIQKIGLESAGKGVLLGGIGSLLLYSTFKKPHNNNNKRAFTGVLAGLCFFPAVANLPVESITKRNEEWVSLSSKVSLLDQLNDPIINTLEIEPSYLTDRGIEIADSLVSSYEDAKKFYNGVNDSLDFVTSIRTPSDDETVALLISDRHDNILMDPIARKIGDLGGATMVIDAGDDTSSGSQLEEFSLNSLNRAFKGYSKISVQGNHDSGEFVGDWFKKLGWKVLDGKIITLNGIKFLGVADPRTSSAIVRMKTGSSTMEEVSEDLARTACQDERLSTVVVHSVTLGERVVEKGCADIVLGGHLHRQVGPSTSFSISDREVTTYTNGTTGGAAYAMAGLTALKRNAQVTLITYNNKGVALGLQPVTVQTDGQVIVQPFTPIPTDYQLVKKRGSKELSAKTGVSPGSTS